MNCLNYTIIFINYVTKQEETYDLLSYYRELRVLWDPSNRDYGLKSKRWEAISVLADKFDTTGAEINRKIHNLRCQFNGEIRNFNRRIKNNTTINDNKCVSNWIFFDIMKEIMGFSEINTTHVSIGHLKIQEKYINSIIKLILFLNK